MSRCIVIQGPSSHVLQVKQCWAGHPIVFSTWEGEESQYEKDDVVLGNVPPSDGGIRNLYYQTVSTLAGLKKAKELGFTRVFKWRSDFVCDDSENLLGHLKNGLNFLFWHRHRHGYFVDYLIEGPVDDLIEMWSFPHEFYPYPEEAITRQIFKKGLGPHHFFGQYLTPEKDIRWLKNNIGISSYQSDNLYVNEVQSPRFQ